jgi:hypothetical protein
MLQGLRDATSGHTSKRVAGVLPHVTPLLKFGASAAGACPCLALFGCPSLDVRRSRPSDVLPRARVAAVRRRLLRVRAPRGPWAAHSELRPRPRTTSTSVRSRAVCCPPWTGPCFGIAPDDRAISIHFCSADHDWPSCDREGVASAHGTKCASFSDARCSLLSAERQLIAHGSASPG